MLAKALQALERDGLVLRTQRSVMPPAVDYELTPLGAAAARQTAALVQWLEDHMDDIATAQTRYDQAGGRSAAR
jgi:DNA-binding HxlR family transcriptional regulator